MTPRVPVCVFAKEPRAGSVKTRLAATIGFTAAAELARAFFDDTWSMLEGLSWAEPILATTEERWALDRVPQDRIWLQGEGTLGARLSRVLRRALGRGRPAIAVGIDSPGLPREHLELALAALSEHEAAIGPTRDGGFYLLGVRRCPPTLLDGLPWSSVETYERTCERLAAFDLPAQKLPVWFDVDEPPDLRRLERLLRRGCVRADQSALWFASNAHRMTR